MAERPERVYRFEPLDGAGIFLGLGIVQCALLGGGLAAGVGAVTAGVPVALAALPALLGAVVSFGRLGGYALWEWLPLGVGWLAGRLGRGPRWFARLPLLPAEVAAPPLPPCLAGLSVVELAWHGGLRLAAVRDDEAHTLTALVPVAGPQFVVEPRAEQERLLGGWGDVLNQFAVERGVVTHLSWSDHARRSGLEEHRRWLGDEGRGAPHPEAADSYRRLLNEATSTASAHEVLVTLTVARDRLGRRRAATAAEPAEPLARALVGSVDALLRGLRAAGLAARDPLRAADVHRLLRARIDPAGSQPHLVEGRLVERLGLVGAAAAGPLALSTSWRSVRADGAWHRCWWVAAWPRLPAAPSWLEPFLTGGGVCRTVTVVFCPVSAHRSRRQIERDLVKLESDAATKEDQGRRVDARHRRATQALLDREEELVAGYAEMTYCGLVAVSAQNEDELERHGEVLEQLAREAGMELRPLDGRQDLAWAAAALPLGLAPRTLLA